jgi:hypothetical protein
VRALFSPCVSSLTVPIRVPQQNKALAKAHADRDHLAAQLEESNRKAAKWQALHKELYMFAVNDLIDRKEKDSGVG